MTVEIKSSIPTTKSRVDDITRLLPEMNYRVTAEKLTDAGLLRRACEMTMRGGKSNASLQDIYRCEHSPIRTQMFWVEMVGIPTFVSVHLVRHKIGVEHFVMSNRDDRGGRTDVGRYSPVNHGMLVNAQALINMARSRLCFKAHQEAVWVMTMIKAAIADVDVDLAGYMVRNCEYRGRCVENVPCDQMRGRKVVMGD